MTKENGKKGIHRQPWLQSLLAMVLIFGALAGFLYYVWSSNVIYIDTSHLDAPIIDLAPSSPGTLNALYVAEGQRIAANSPVALVGTETLYAKEGGIILGAPRALGSYYAPGQTVLSVVVDQKMRLVATLDETNGLDLLAPGQHVVFTVDAFPGKSYEGVLERIAPASDEAGIAFSISDKRPVKQFNAYVRFDASQYPELKTGMSARAWIYIK